MSTVVVVVVFNVILELLTVVYVEKMGRKKKTKHKFNKYIGRILHIC